MITRPFSNFYNKNLNKVKIVYIGYFEELIKLSFFFKAQFIKCHTIYKMSKENS
jgi:hypothetical protein